MCGTCEGREEQKIYCICEQNKSFQRQPKVMLLVVFIVLICGQSLAQDCGRNTVTDELDDVTVGPFIHASGEEEEFLAKRGSWPWLASLGRFRQDEWTHFCGGTLVTDKHVLTAAHCMVSEVTEVRLGDGALSDNVGVQWRLIIDYVTHPKYKPGLPYHDVAILTLDSPANITGNYVRPICLPDTSSDIIDEFDGDQMYVAGWGFTTLNGLPSDVNELRQVQQRVFKNSFCNASHSITSRRFLNDQITRYLPSLFTSNLMCAGYEFGGKGSCKGDSGGPLIRFNYGDGPSSVKYVQQGIVQGAIGSCGNKNFPSIYVRIKDPEVFKFIQNSILSLENRTATTLAQNLHLAVLNNNTSLVHSILVGNNDNLEFVNNRIADNGVLKTSLDIASANGLIEVVKLLIRVSKADPNVKDSNGYSAAFKAIQNDNFQVLKILVEEGGANVDDANGPDRITLLMAAINNPKNQDAMWYLIPKIKNIDQKNSKGYTCLFIATEKNQLDIVQILLLVGNADVNMKNGEGGWTSAMRASELGHQDLLKLLIEIGGADPNIRSDKDGRTALHFASNGQDRTTVEYLISHLNVNASQKDNNGFTPLYLAAEAGSIEVVKFLVEKAKVNINSKNGLGINSIPLGISAQNGHLITVQYLLNHGAKDHIDYLNLEKVSPLYLAAEKGHTSIVKTLISLGKANVELRNTDRLWTALHVAAHHGHVGVITYLMQDALVYPFQLTGNGKDTALSLAEKNGQQGAVAYIKLVFNLQAENAEKTGRNDWVKLIRAMLSTPPYTFEQHYPGVNVSAIWADILSKKREREIQ